MRQAFVFKGIYFAVLFASFLFNQNPLRAEQVQASSPATGLVAHYYGCLGFNMYGGTTGFQNLNIKQNMDQLKWPQPNWDKEKGPLFNRNSGWSMAMYGSLKIEIDGEYVFRLEGDPAELRIDGTPVAADGRTTIRLSNGQHTLTLFARSRQTVEPGTGGPKDSNANVHVTWKKPTGADFEEISPDFISHSTSDTQKTVANIFDIEFKEGIMPFVGMRDYKVEIPEDGFYEFAILFHSSPWPHRYIWAMMDGKTLFHSNRMATRKLQLLGTYGTSRFITKGTHVFRLSSYTQHFTNTDMTGFLEEARVGLRKLLPEMTDRTLAIYEKDRDDAVFEKGERFILAIEQSTKEPVSYTVNVREQRGADTTVWTKKVELPGGKKHAVTDVEMPSATEGAFEYTVLDAGGKILEGPWSFIVIDPTPLPPATEKDVAKIAKPVLVDTIDCSLPEDPVHKFRDNGTSKVISEDGIKFRVTGEDGYRTVGYIQADKFNQVKNGPWRRAKESEKAQLNYQTMDWCAWTLNVKNPGRPHMVTVWVPTKLRRYVAVQVFDQVTGQCNGAVMETGNAPRSDKLTPLSFAVWPNGKGLDLMIFCHNMPKGHPGYSVFDNKQGAASKIELFEFPDGFPPLPEAAGGWSPERQFGWMGEQVNIGIEQRTMVKFFPGSDMIPGNMNSGGEWGWYGGGYYDWKALFEVWSRLGEFSRYRGDNVLIWPVFSYSMSMLTLDRLPKGFEVYSDGYGYRPVDRLRRDQLKLIFLVLQKYGMKFVPDMQIHWTSAEHVLATAKDGKWTADGLFVTGLDGKPFTGNSGATVLNPAHPLSRKYLIDMYGELAVKYGKYKSFGGANLRQWDGWNSNNAAWFVGANYGYDDFTIGLFEKETGIKVPAETADPDRFRKRRDFLIGKEREKWFAWRRDKTISLWEDVLKEVRKTAPDARLYGGFPPRFDEGRGLDEKILADRADLGFGRKGKFGGKGTEVNELDPIDFMNFDQREGVEHRSLEKLYGAVDKSYPYGLCSGDGSAIRCPPYELEEPSMKLSMEPQDLIQYGGPWVLPPMDDGIRNWARAWRAIPILPYERFGGKSFEKEPIQCWSAKTLKSVMGLWSKKGVVFYLVNTTPIARNVSVAFDDEAGSVMNLVSGKTESGVRKIEVFIKPFMLELFAAEGVSKVKSVRIAQEEIEVKATLYAPVAKVATGARIEVPNFVIDKFEVTNAMFELFKPERRKERNPASPSDNSPVVDVTWYDAIAYCNWRSEVKGLQPCYDLKTGHCDFSKDGYRLPAESEWELAAGGGVNTPYPWGAKSPSEGLALRCNYGHYDVTVPGNSFGNDKIKNVFEVTAPVGSFPEFSSPCGAADMAGNVWEWCQNISESGNNKSQQVLRGGSWRSDSSRVTIASRATCDTKSKSDCVGFRCVRRSAGQAVPPFSPTTTASSAKWWTADYEFRCPLTLAENAGVPRNGELVVISGSQLLGSAPGVDIPAKSIRIVDGTGQIISQVDEKDGTGSYVSNPNGMLDADDEICFQASLKANEKKLMFIYFSRTSKLEEGQKCLEVEFVEAMSGQKPYKIRVANGSIELGVAGAEKPANDSEKWKEWQAGRMTVLKADGIDMLSCWNPNGTLPNGTWPELKEVVLAAKGPVRVVFEARFGEANVDWFLGDARFWNDANLKNCSKTFRYQVATGSPLVEFIEDLRYAEKGLDIYRGGWPYMAVNVAGRGMNPSSQVLAPGKDGRAEDLSVEKGLAGKMKDAVLQDHVELGGNRDGWVGYIDTEKKNGFAIFGSPTADNISVLFMNGSVFNKSSGPVFRCFYNNESIPPKRLVRRYGFMVLRTETAADLENAYKVFAMPVKTSVSALEYAPAVNPAKSNKAK